MRPATERMAASKGHKNTLLSDAGRPVWYDYNGQSRPAFVIGIAGGSASGKTRVAEEILKALDVPWVLTVSQDSFYKSLTPEQSQAAFANLHDFDSPPAFDFDKLKECLIDLKESRSCQIPQYSFVKHQRLAETSYLYGATIVIVEGIFVLQDPEIRDLLDLKIFVQADSDLMLARRIRRDTVERGRDLQGILQQYLTFVKPSFDTFVLPTAKFADLIIPGLENSVAISLVVTHIGNQLESRRRFQVRPMLSRSRSQHMHSINGTSLPALPDNVHLLDSQGGCTQQAGIQTILRNSKSSPEDFIFFSHRLATLLIEESLKFIPSKPKTVTTSTGLPYQGTELDVENVCAFTILRSGEVLERGLRRVLRDVPLCSALIQSDPSTGEPFLYQLSMCSKLKRREDAAKSTVLILDSQIGTAAAALMAVRILLDHGVPEENIVLVVVLLSRAGGIHHLCKVFPKIKVLTSAVDDGLKELWIPNSDHEGAWRAREDEHLSSSSSSSDEGGESDAGDVEEAEEEVVVQRDNGSSIERRGKHARIGGLQRPGSADRRGKKVYAILPGMGSFGTRFFGS